MKSFMSDNFLLDNPTAEELYSAVRDLPVFDYHCHLSPEEIYRDRAFYNLTQLWLECDHYKWRVMRNAGVDERYITGDALDYDKFLAFAKVLPDFAGNPVYQWAHLELKKYFGITTPLSEDTAQEIWEKTLGIMADGGFSARKLIARSGVDTVITTDDPTDELKFHELLQKEDLTFAVLPCFRPDKAINIDKDGFCDYIARLSSASGINIVSVDTLCDALAARLDYFVAHGAVAVDCSFKNFAGGEDCDAVAEKAFAKKINGEKPSAEECSEFSFAVTKRLAAMFRERGLVMQIHTGVLRNQNTTRFAAIGADCGIDSVGNCVDVEAAGRLFDAVEKEGGMPKTIVYTLNPASYYPLATMLGNFAGESRGKMQLGAAWWFLDHRDGIREQLAVFAATAGIGHFNGMLTDSRSFVSYARHDYFRRVLCSVLGKMAEDGEYPTGEPLRRLAQNISYYNAKNYFVGGGNKK